jgi:hypothetical protein
MKTRLLYLFATLFATFSLYSQEVPVEQSQLPAEAKAFLKEHFKSKFHHAIKDVEGRSITYEVVLNDNTEIEFDEAGKWKEVEGKDGPIPITFIQKQTLDYVKINHPKESIMKIERSQSEYKVGLSNGLGLKFDMMGVFVKLD